MKARDDVSLHNHATVVGFLTNCLQIVALLTLQPGLFLALTLFEQVGVVARAPVVPHVVSAKFEEHLVAQQLTPHAHHLHIPISVLDPRIPPTTFGRLAQAGRLTSAFALDDVEGGVCV
jgi:hypothetical protein